MLLCSAYFFWYFARTIADTSFQKWPTNAVCEQKDKCVWRDLWAEGFGSGWWRKAGLSSSTELELCRNWIPTKSRPVFWKLTEIHNKNIHLEDNVLPSSSFSLLFLTSLSILPSSVSFHEFYSRGTEQIRWILLRRDCWFGVRLLVQCANYEHIYNMKRRERAGRLEDQSCFQINRWADIEARGLIEAVERIDIFGRFLKAFSSNTEMELINQ